MAGNPREAVTVEVDGDLCTGSGMCRQIAPQLFDLPADGDVAVVLMPTVSDPELIALALEAEQACPTTAVRVSKT